MDRPLSPAHQPPIATDAWMVQALPGRSRWRRGGVTPAMKGELVLDGGRLSFRPAGSEGESDTTIIARDVRSVTRSKRSPVIEVRLGGEGLPSVVWFYFIEPPDLHYRRGGVATKRIAVLALSEPFVGDEVQVWVDRIRATVESARRG